MKTLSIHEFLAVLRRTAAACALAASALIAVPGVSLACKCAPPPGATEAMKQATAVFEAQVTQLNPTEDALEVTLHVARAWKGVDGETARVRTRRDTAACGVPFEVGRSYIVYATQSTTPNSSIALEALACGRTRLAEQADEDFTELGLGVVPVAPREPASTTPASAAAAPAVQPGTDAAPKPVDPAAGGCASCSLGASGRHPPVAGWLAFAAIVLLRRRRRALRT